MKDSNEIETDKMQVYEKMEKIEEDELLNEH